MSAYDNPTIIKDESAQIWAEGLTSIGEKFTKSFIQARALRNEEIKYARDQKIKAQRESEELLEKSQVRKEKNNLDASKKVSDVRSTWKDYSPSTVSLITDQYASMLTKSGEYNEKLYDSSITQEERNFYSKYQDNVNTIMAKDKPILGAGFSQVKGYSEMTGAQTKNIVWRGNDELDRMISRETCSALDQKNTFYNGELKEGEKSKVLKEYTAKPEETNPTSNFKVVTTIGSKEQLKDLLDDFYPSSKAGNIDAAIEAGIKNGKIINEGDNYKIVFDKTVGETWDGTFYNEIPERTKGDLWDKDNGNVFLKDGNTLKENYITQPELIVVKDGKRNLEAQRRYVKAKDLEQTLATSYVAEAQGLLASNLKDPQVLQGYFLNRLKDPNMTVEEFQRTYKTNEAQANYLAQNMLELDIENRLSGSYKSQPATEEEIAKGLADSNGQVWYSDEKEKTYFDQKASSSKSSESKEKGIKQIFTPEQIQDYRDQFNTLANDSTKDFQIEIPGPKGGTGKTITFYTDDQRKIRSEGSNKVWNRQTFLNYLKSLKR